MIRRAARLLLVSGALSVPASAHEPGTTAVIVTVTGRAYVVDITTDAASLLARLEIAAGVPRSGPPAAGAYAAKVQALGSALLDRIELRFDGARVQPRVELLPADAEHAADPGGAAARIRLRGAVPAGAGTLTWRAALTSTSYTLAVVTANGSASPALRIDGDAPSPPLALASGRRRRPHGDMTGTRTDAAAARHRSVITVLGALVVALRLIPTIARRGSRPREA